MASVIAVSVAAAGLVFSLSVGLLVEELIFGAIFRLFFGQRGWTKRSTTHGMNAGFEYTETGNAVVANGTVGQ